MATEDTHSTTDNTGGVPTQAALIEYLQDVDRPVSLDQLASATVATREGLKPRLEQLEARGLIIVSMGLYHVTISLVDGPHLVADGGRDPNTLDLDLTETELFRAVSCQRRRELIRLLADGAGWQNDEYYFNVSMLAEQLTAAESNAVDGISGDRDHRHSVYVALSQQHLPALDEIGVIDYYDRPQKLSIRGDLLEIAALLELVAERTIDGVETTEATGEKSE